MDVAVMNRDKRIESLATLERKPLKCGSVGTKDSFVRAGSVVERALDRAYPKQEAAASDYGVSPSLLSRQMRNQDDQHLSFQRLWSMPKPFKRELLAAMASDLAEDTDSVTVTERVVIEFPCTGKKASA